MTAAGERRAGAGGGVTLVAVCLVRVVLPSTVEVCVVVVVVVVVPLGEVTFRIAQWVEEDQLWGAGLGRVTAAVGGAATRGCTQAGTMAVRVEPGTITAAAGRAPSCSVRALCAEEQPASSAIPRPPRMLAASIPAVIRALTTPWPRRGQANRW